MWPVQVADTSPANQDLSSEDQNRFFCHQGRRTAQLRDGDKMVEFQTVSTNEIVMRYKIVYYEIITICELIETNTRKIQTMEAGPEKDRLVEV